jgi:protein-tyrosine kinase
MMSRFEKALERAKAAGPEPQIPAGVVPKDVPSAALFDAPWEVGDQPSPPAAPAATSRAQAAAPAARLRRSVSVRPSLHPDLQQKVVTSEGMPAVAIEQYRKVAARLHHEQLEKHIHTLMVVSAVSGEGKTLTSLNLSLTLASSYKRRVLLIDADLRLPRIHAAFQLPGDPGLHEAIDAAPGTPLPIVDVDEQLSLLPAGRSTTDPMDVLSSPRVAGLIDDVKREFDWVVIDTAPLAVLPDANLLARVVDAAVLVVSAGQTEYDLVERAIKLLGRDRILGVVLNGVDDRDIRASSYYASYYNRR